MPVPGVVALLAAPDANVRLIRNLRVKRGIDRLGVQPLRFLRLVAPDRQHRGGKVGNRAAALNVHLVGLLVFAAALADVMDKPDMAVEQFPAAQTALEEYQSIEQQMASPEVVTNPDKMRKLGRRHAELGAIVSAYQSYTAVRDDLEAAREMAGEDPEFADEAKRLEAELPAAEEKLRNALIPRDPDDARDVIMEINDRTINVYMKAFISLREPRIPGNRHSDYRSELVLAWSKIY